MDSVERIEDLIVAASEDLFEEPEIREDLHVTIRVARDFYEFLLKFGETPPPEEIDYVIGTIRAGMDEFFQLAYLCRIITGSETWRFETHPHWDFPALRAKFLHGFEQLSIPDASVSDRLASLLGLTHLELVFLAQHFPSVIIRDWPRAPEATAEFLSDLAEWNAGRLSFDEFKARLVRRGYKSR